MDSTLTRFSIDRAHMRIPEAWEKIMGKFGLEASIIGLRGKKLTVGCDNAVLLQELTMRKRDIIARINSELGEEFIDDIRLKSLRREDGGEKEKKEGRK